MSSSSDCDRPEIVKTELERLNGAARLINQYENIAETYRNQYKECVAEYGRDLSAVACNIGKSAIERARLYHDTVELAQKARIKACQASVDYVHSSSAWEATVSTTALAQALKTIDVSASSADISLDTLRMKLRTIEANRNSIEQIHKQKSIEYALALQKARYFESKFARSIKKARSYFNLRTEFNQKLIAMQRAYLKILADINYQKEIYSQALSNLEQLSETIRAEKFKDVVDEEKNIDENCSDQLYLDFSTPGPPYIRALSENGLSSDEQSSKLIIQRTNSF